MIEDWEIGQLYWNCFRNAKGKNLEEREMDALEKVKNKYFDEFVSKNELYFFVGTTKEWHLRRGYNPFVIIGVFYPLKDSQLSLFY